MDVRPEVIALVAAAIALWLFFSKRRKPKEPSFRCTRCSVVAPHTVRTINAWREGKTKFFSTSLRVLVVCHCYRQKDEVIRIISARKADREEQRQYRWWLR